MMKTLLSVAGFDPSAGAGALLDVRVFNRLGFHGAAVLTAVTAQNTRAVQDVQILPARFVLKQFDVLAADLHIAGVKVGMLGGTEGIRALKEILVRTKDVPQVVDPVFRSSSGYWLIRKGMTPAFLRVIRNRATLITPNISEAEQMSGQKIRDVADQKTAAHYISELAGIPCLLKGGHLKGPPTDVLYDGCRYTLFRHGRVRKDVHGTGCFLSSAVLAYLAGGSLLERACRSAVELTVKALAGARTVGGGRSVFKGF